MFQLTNLPVTKYLIIIILEAYHSYLPSKTWTNKKYSHIIYERHKDLEVTSIRDHRSMVFNFYNSNSNTNNNLPRHNINHTTSSYVDFSIFRPPWYNHYESRNRCDRGRHML